MRTVLVTGSASGIGAATTALLRAEGQRVITLDIQGGDVTADLGSSAGRAAAIDAVAKECDGRLDGVLSCAALGPVQAAEPVLRVNYFGAMAILDELLPLLAAGDAPAAVGIASIGAIYPEIVPELHLDAVLAACAAGDEEAAVRAIAGQTGNTAYCLAKRALALGVRSRAQAWGERGVRLNAIAPGMIDTPMLDDIKADATLGPGVVAMPVPLGRQAPPAEMASVIAFLLGPAASYVHGAVIHADGGADALVRPGTL